MAKHIALHTLHLTSAKAGAIDVIPAGHRFDADDADDVADLIKRGAVRESNDGDALAPKAERQTGSVAKRSSADSVDGTASTAAVTVPDDQLHELTVEKLKAIAAELNVNASGLKKDELVSAIVAKRAEPADDLV